MACGFLFVVLVWSSWLAAADEIQIPGRALTFGEGYTQLFGDSNLRLHDDGKLVHISLDERTGSGFASQRAYLHGLFSASIKLPTADYAAGVVVAFYVSYTGVYLCRSTY
jgi:xyloglucan:xyloglucosyl transferase